MASRKIWVANKSQGWELGEVLEDSSVGVTVRCADGERIVNKADTFRSDFTHFSDLDDLCRMTHLHEAPLLDALRRRFEQDDIYTNAGDILLSVNPYKHIHGIYDNPLRFLDLPEDGDIDISVGKPHVFKVANFALLQLLYASRQLTEDRAPANQSVVVSGESGAGKTEASKHVMNFLIAADSEISGCQASDRGHDRLGDNIKEVLVRSNIIFEAFGNAKTLRNDNSSRFGKYIKLQYSDQNRIVSAFTETFLLEKSRLTMISSKERNYHVFYQLIAGASHELRQKLHLTTPGQFRMLTDNNGVASAAPQDSLFHELEEALLTVGCTTTELNSLWTLIAAMLHVGNLTCKDKPDALSAESETVGESHSIDDNLFIESPLVHLDELSEWLGVSSQMFRSRLTTQRVKVSTRRSVTVKRLNHKDANNNVAALVKWMYSCVFSWLVLKVNYAHCNVSDAETFAEKFIGILDIFGFEILQTNSFEQLCINFTNERLQQQFNEYVFDREQTMYKTEGLDWATINYKDNQHVIDLIGKKPSGLLPILEGQGMLNRGSADEAALVSSFNQTHDKKSAAYEKSRFTDLRFTVKHFAGDVTYTVAGFMEKNNDSLQEDLLELMVCSTNEFVRNAVVAVGMGDLATPDELGYVPPIAPGKVVQTSAGHLSMARDPVKKMAATGRRQSLVVPANGAGSGSAATGGGKKLASSVTVSFQFRSQLDILIGTLRATSPHYIKCIKPNGSKVSSVFEGSLVLEQLRYSGALEVVRIRQEGYPVCVPFVQFYELFEQLAFQRQWVPSQRCTDDEAKQYVSTLCSESLQPIVDYQIGATKLFMKSESYDKLFAVVEAFLGTKVRKWQALVRRVIARKRFRVALRCVIIMQSVTRMHIHRRRFRVEVAEYRATLERARLLREAERRRAQEEQRRAEAEFQRLEEERLRQEEAKRQEEELRKQFEEGLRLAKEEQCRAEQQRIHSLHDAAVKGDLAAVKAALSVRLADYLERDTRRCNCTLLQSAALSGNLAVVKYLQPSPCDLWLRDSHGNTVAHYALEGLGPDSLELLRYLVFVNNGNVDRGAVDDARPELPPSFERKETQPPAAVSQTAQVKELKAGWLHKRGESSVWRKRWVRLTSEALMYFRNNRDSVPRDTLSFATQNDIRIERPSNKPTAIDIYINHQSAVKKRSRVSLMADSEQEMQIWLNLLRAAAGVETQPLRDESALPLRVVVDELRQRFFEQTNAVGETLLHVLTRRAAAAPTGALDSASLVVLAAWLAQNGASLQAFNADGLTPLQLASQLQQQALASLFASQGANPEQSMLGGAKHTSLSLSPSVEFQLQLKRAYDNHFSSVQTSERFRSGPPMLRGFHYLSLYCAWSDVFQAKDFTGTADKICLRITALTKSGSSLDIAQTTRLHAVVPGAGDTQRWQWFDTMHVNFPLNGLDDDCFLSLELLTGETCLVTARLDMDKRTIQTGPVALIFIAGDGAPHSQLLGELRISTRAK